MLNTSEVINKTEYLHHQCPKVDHSTFNIHVHSCSHLDKSRFKTFDEYCIASESDVDNRNCKEILNCLIKTLQGGCTGKIYDGRNRFLRGVVE